MLAGQAPQPIRQPAGSAAGPGGCPGLRRVVERRGRRGKDLDLRWCGPRLPLALSEELDQTGSLLALTGGHKDLHLRQGPDG